MEMADRCFTIDWKSHVLTMMDSTVAESKPAYAESKDYVL